MAGEKLCFVAAVVVAAVYETEKVQKIRQAFVGVVGSLFSIANLTIQNVLDITHMKLCNTGNMYFFSYYLLILVHK
jgi:hypothetical protein